MQSQIIYLKSEIYLIQFYTSGPLGDFFSISAIALKPCEVYLWGLLYTLHEYFLKIRWKVPFLHSTFIYSKLPKLFLKYVYFCKADFRKSDDSSK